MSALETVSPLSSPAKATSLFQEFFPRYLCSVETLSVIEWIVSTEYFNAGAIFFYKRNDSHPFYRDRFSLREDNHELAFSRS